MGKKLLAFLLSLQMGALHYAIPLMALSFTQSSQAGEKGGVESDKPPADKKQSDPPRFQKQTDNHGPRYTSEEAPQGTSKSGFCKDPTTGKMKGGCIFALILIVGAIAAILIANSNNGSSKKYTYGGSSGGGNGGGGGVPGSRPPIGGRPPKVPCCGNAAPAPAPGGGGTVSTSVVSTGNTLPTDVTPVIVTPENAAAPTPSAADGDI